MTVRQIDDQDKLFAEKNMLDLESGEFFDWDMDGEVSDGCVVEPDGYCEHGRPSWLLVAGLI